ncbi:LytTR family DNA-binding domain-containing protein [soil metagenome]
MSVQGLGIRKYQCLVVDDNKVASLLLVQLLAQIPGLVVAGTCESATEAAVFLSRIKIDLLFLDIEMPGMNGIELLRSLPDKPLTILTSANKGYALEAFELNVVDYVVKPVMLPRLMTAVSRAIELIQQEGVVLNNVEQDYIFIKDGKTIRKILFDDIFFIEAKGDYVKIHFADKYYVIHATLKVLEEKLSLKKFLRVHRSYIVAIDKIDYIEDNVLFLNSVPVPLSEFYKSRVLNQLNFL